MEFSVDEGEECIFSFDEETVEQNIDEEDIGQNESDKKYIFNGNFGRIYFEGDRAIKEFYPGPFDEGDLDDDGISFIKKKQGGECRSQEKSLQYFIKIFSILHVSGRLVVEMECGRADFSYLPIAEINSNFIGLMDAIDFLRRQKLVHGDIKPSNLLLSSTGRLVLSDLIKLCACNYRGEGHKNIFSEVYYSVVAAQHFNDKEPFDICSESLYALLLTYFSIVSDTPRYKDAVTSVVKEMKNVFSTPLIASRAVQTKVKLFFAAAEHCSDLKPAQQIWEGLPDGYRNCN